MGCRASRRIPEVVSHCGDSPGRLLHDTLTPHIHATILQTYLGHRVLDHLFIRHVALVAYEEFVDALSRVPVNLLQPLLDIVKRVHVRDVVDDADAVRAAVVGRGDCAETFLARRIPLLVLVGPCILSYVACYRGRRTIWSLTVLPSSSMVRIFCPVSERIM
jgi:hypothetical protein